MKNIRSRTYFWIVSPNILPKNLTSLRSGTVKSAFALLGAVLEELNPRIIEDRTVEREGLNLFKLRARAARKLRVHDDDIISKFKLSGLVCTQKKSTCYSS